MRRAVVVHPRPVASVGQAHNATRRRRSDGSLLTPAVLLYAIFCVHVLASPFTKVEESWTLHAVHDALVHGFGSGLSNVSLGSSIRAE